MGRWHVRDGGQGDDRVTTVVGPDGTVTDEYVEHAGRLLMCVGLPVHDNPMLVSTSIFAPCAPLWCVAYLIGPDIALDP